MRKTYQGTSSKSEQKFELVGNRQLAVNVPLPLVEVWEEQPEVEHLAGMAGLQIIRAVIEDEVARRVEPRYQPDAASDCRRWEQQPGYVVFGGRKVAVERPRVRTREGEEMELDSYARLQHDGRRQRACRPPARRGRARSACRRCRRARIWQGSSVAPYRHRSRSASCVTCV